MRTYLLLLLVVLSLIPSAQRVDGAQEEPGIPPELRRQALENGTYETPTTGRVRLVDGQFQETRALPGTDYKYTVSAKLQQPIGYGRWHNLPVAAVVVAANGGGSGTFYNLILLLGVNGEVVPLGRAELGDRIRVNALSFAPDGQIVVDMMDHGPGDGLCCVSVRVEKRYRFGLQRVPETPSPRQRQRSPSSS